MLNNGYDRKKLCDKYVKYGRKLINAKMSNNLDKIGLYNKKIVQYRNLLQKGGSVDDLDFKIKDVITQLDAQINASDKAFDIKTLQNNFEKLSEILKTNDEKINEIAQDLKEKTVTLAEETKAKDDSQQELKDYKNHVENLLQGYLKNITDLNTKLDKHKQLIETMLKPENFFGAENYKFIKELKNPPPPPL